MPEFVGMHPGEEEPGMHDIWVDYAPEAELWRVHECGGLWSDPGKTPDCSFRCKDDVSRPRNLVTCARDVRLVQEICISKRKTTVDVTGASKWQADWPHFYVLRAIAITDNEYSGLN
jgi:hypothetical protein